MVIILCKIRHVKDKNADRGIILKCIWKFGDVQFIRIIYFLPGLQASQIVTLSLLTHIKYSNSLHILIYLFCKILKY
jgi:hypothetical protein